MKALFIIPLFLIIGIAPLLAQKYQVHKRPQAIHCFTKSWLQLPTNASNGQTFEVKLRLSVPSSMSQAVLYIENRRIDTKSAPFTWVVNPKRFRLSKGRQRVQVKMKNQCGRVSVLKGQFDLN